MVKVFLAVKRRVSLVIRLLEGMGIRVLFLELFQLKNALMEDGTPIDIVLKPPWACLQG
ncbi:MAG: hypothetical protein Ct9H300mP6_04220 [Gammaproteobacteria bacterium]|nr:MAG: hypothetical protein Ct9H300mP6_04220 [Gammaproteobacteria bacterium]